MTVLLLRLLLEPPQAQLLLYDSVSPSCFMTLTNVKPACPMHNTKSSSINSPQKTWLSSLNTSKPVNATNQPEISSNWSFLKLNPLNCMPLNISQSPDINQTSALPVERTLSSIPRGDSNANWEYPSPQQMYNAMLRKGYDDTPEDAVESMVAVHNFLNEGAWREVEGWEERFSRGLGHGWRLCQLGEEGFSRKLWSSDEAQKPKLLRFHGRPNDMTPKAQIIAMLGWIYPARFGYVNFMSTNGTAADLLQVPSRHLTGMIGTCCVNYRTVGSAK